MFFAARFGMRKYTARNAGRKAKRNTELEKTIGQRFHSVRQTLCMIAEVLQVTGDELGTPSIS